MSTRFIVLSLLVVMTYAGLTGCKPGQSGMKDGIVIPYDLNNPEEHELVDDLQEISGISPTVDNQALWAINDETGKLYKLDFNGKIISAKWFHKGGDYEDVVAVDSQVYVMKSNANLYRVDDPEADSLTAQSFKSNIDKAIEFESAAADLENNRILLLVKDGESSNGKAPVYGFDLSKQAYQPGHVLLIEPKQVKGISVKGKSLRASAMAIHPLTGHLYIITSIQRLLLVCDKDGNGIGFQKLSKKRYPQPEGICFLPDGTMFISTEGLSRPAKLFRFKYQPEMPAAPSVPDSVPQ